MKDDVGLHHAIVVQLAKVAHTTHTLLVVPRLIHLTDIRQTHIHTHPFNGSFSGDHPGKPAPERQNQSGFY